MDVELFYLLHMFNIPCRYHPVHFENKDFSQINVWRCMLFDPIDMVKIKLRGFRGMYTHNVDSQPWLTLNSANQSCTSGDDFQAAA